MDKKEPGTIVYLTGLFEKNKGVLPVYWVCCAVILLSIILHSERAFEYMTFAPSGLEISEMADGEVYSQEIESGAKRLRSLWIKFSTFERVNHGSVTVVFYKNGEEVRSWNLDASELTDDKYREFAFGRQIRIREEDRCSFTVKEDFSGEENQLGLWKPVAPEGEEGEEGEEEAGICYRLRLGDPGRRAGCMIPVTVIFLILFAAAAAFVDFRGFGPVRMIVVTLGILVLIEAVTVDLFQRIRREVPLYTFSVENERKLLGPGESMEDRIRILRADFTSLQLSVSDKEDRSLNIRVRLENEDTGETCYDGLIPAREFISGGPAGRIIQVSSPGTGPDEMFPAGTYKVTVTNEDPEKNLYLCVTAEEETDQETDQEADEESEAEKKLDFAVMRTSGLGYGTAFFIIFLLCAYVIAVGMLLAGQDFSMKRLYILSAVPLSVIYLILFAPWNIPDNKDHFWAAYRISSAMMGGKEEDEWKLRADDAAFYEGHMGEGNPGTGSIGEMIWNVRPGVQDKTRTETEPSDKMKFYSAVNYLPQAFGLTLGRLLGLGTVLTIFLGRLCILAVFIAGCAHAVRITPVGKAVFAAIPLLPMALMIAGSYSYDAMVLVSTLCFTASVLRARLETGSRPAYIECIVWVLVLGGVKGGAFLIFLPLALMLMYSDRLRVLPVLAAGGVSVLIFDVLLAPDSLYQLGEEGSGTMTASFAFAHPLKFLDLLASTYLNTIDEIVLNMGGTRLGWLEATIPAAVIGGLLAVIAVWAVFEKDLIRFRKIDRGLFLWVLGMEFVFTPMMLLSWTEYGDDRIRGLQGRYYLPVLILLYFVFTKFSLRAGAGSGSGTASASSQARDAVVKKCAVCFCALSCLSVYYLMRMYLAR